MALVCTWAAVARSDPPVTRAPRRWQRRFTVQAERWGAPRPAIFVRGNRETDLRRLAPGVDERADRIVDPGRTANRVEDQVARFLDTDPMGSAATERPVWLRTYHGVRVVHETRPETVRVDLTVAFDRDTGQLLAAWTPSRPQWVQPAAEPVHDADSLYMSRVTFSRPARPESLTTGIPRVLAKLWRYSVNPLVPGQVVLRPRLMVPRTPARREGGRIVPLLPAATRWVVTTYGHRARSRDDFREGRWVELYCWGMVMLVNDHPLRWVWTTYL